VTSLVFENVLFRAAQREKKRETEIQTSSPSPPDGKVLRNNPIIFHF